MSRPSDSASAPSRDTVAKLFARLTADRDELRAELELYDRRIAALEQAVASADGPAPATLPSSDADPSAKALRLAEEALATAQYALEQARRRR